MNTDHPGESIEQQIANTRRPFDPQGDSPRARAPEQILLTADEAAKALSICTRTLWLLTKSKKIASVRIGRAVRYRPEDLRAYAEANLVGA